MQLKKIEDQIHDVEESYIIETSGTGNLFYLCKLT